MKFSGILVEGRQEATGFLALQWVASQLREKLGYEPFPGTMNLELRDPAALAEWKRLRSGEPPMLLASPDVSFCDAYLYPVVVNGATTGAIVLPLIEDYPENVVEVLAPENLRNRFNLNNGSECQLAAGERPVFEAANRYGAVLFDFEGTLVDFQWKLPEAEAELRQMLASLGFDLAPFAKDNYAVLRTRALSLATGEEQKAEIDRRFGEIYDRYDQDALSRWALKPGAPELLSDLAQDGVKTAVVSNVGRKALYAAMKKLGISSKVGVIVTRNDVTLAKPSGEGLLKALEELKIPPAKTIMIGDSLSDLLAARDAGTDIAIILGGESPTQVLVDSRPEHLVNTLDALGAIL